MPRGGARPGSGPQKGTKYRPRATKEPGAVKKPAKVKGVKAGEVIPPPLVGGPEKPEETKQEPENLTPLEYMLRVMNDPSEPAARRAWAAQAAAPYVHVRSGNKGQKEEKSERAKAASTGKFAAGQPPAKILPFKKGTTDEL